MWHVCRDAVCVGRWIYDFQTLIGAGIALLSAVMAIAPLHAQLARMKTQNDGLSREVTKQQILETDRRRSELTALFSPLARNLGSDEFPPNPERAFHLEHDVETTRAKFSDFANALHESQNIEQAKRQVDLDLAVVSDLLTAIHLPESFAEDEENPLTEARETELENGATEAKRAYLGEVSSFAASVERLRMLYNSQGSALRKRLKSLDDAIVQQA